MEQTSYLDNMQNHHVVNVASVPQRSPFRYPGGKTWLVPRIRDWISSKSARPSVFIEPFTGGGIIGLTVAFERLAKHVVMVELDHQVAAVWLTILKGDGEWLANRIANFAFSANSVEETLAVPASTTQELAFQTILRNRINRGGILANGAGKIKHGENGKGLASRWYPQTLKQRILDIISVRERIEFIEGDGLDVMRNYTQDANSVCFIDPPYTAGGKRAGSRLYKHFELDHERLFEIAASMKGDFLMTYDDAEEIRNLAQKHSFDTHLVAMKSTHHARMTELLIGKDLDWAR